MTLSQEQNIVHAIQKQTEQLIKLFQQHKPFGMWQVCPMCSGWKTVNNPLFGTGENTMIEIDCPICKGEGILPRPEIK